MTEWRKDDHTESPGSGQSAIHFTSSSSKVAELKLKWTSGVPSVWSTGAKGCMLHVSGHVTGCISTVAFSFIVQLPAC